MTAVDNVMVGEHSRMHAKGGTPFRTPSERREERDVEQRAPDAATAGNRGLCRCLRAQPSLRLQRRLEIARALASDPSLLLLDEPAAGLNQREKRELMELIGQLRADGLTIFSSSTICAWSWESATGSCARSRQKIAEGAPQAVRENPRVIEAYLGSGASEMQVS